MSAPAVSIDPTPPIPVPAPTPDGATDRAPRRRLWRRWRIPIVWAIGLSFTGLTLASLALGLGIALSGSGRIAHTLVAERVNGMLSELDHRMRGHLQPVGRYLTLLQTQVARGHLDLDDRAAVTRAITDVLAETPQVLGIGYVRPDLTIDRFPAGKPPIYGDDWSQRPGIKAMVAVARATRVADWWRRPHWSTMANLPLVGFDAPLWQGDRFRGVFAAVVTTIALSEPLVGLGAETGHTPFILIGWDRVLAHPSFVTEPPAVSRERPLPRIDEVGDPVLASLHSRRWPLPPAIRDAFDGEAFVVRDPDDRAFAVMVRHFVGGRPASLPILIGLHTDHSEVFGELVTLRTIALVCLGILVVSVALSLAIGRLASRPIIRLAAAAAEVEARHFEDVRPLPPSPIREFDIAATAFNAMVKGVRERQRLRDLFGRYVSPEVVERALKDAGLLRLGGERRAVSLVFSDIAGFTALSEAHPPEEVVRLLNAYLEQVCRIIADERGIVVDFIGDAVFAMFGAPIAADDHPARAFAAARRIDAFALAFAADAQARDLPFGITRLGVHSGVAMVGNFGSERRIKYGAAGDVVNTAARLEAANRRFGTRLLVSQGTVTGAGLVGQVRPLARLAFKGKSQPVEVFEPLTPAEVAAPWFALYLDAYRRLDHDPEGARAMLAALAAERPEDPVLRFHLARLAMRPVSSVVVLDEK